MQNREKASVAANNSICAVPTTAKWRLRVFDARMRNEKFSERPMLYRVRIDGRQWRMEEKGYVATNIERTYEECHPLMAVGRAVSEFFHGSVRMDDISVYQLYAAKPRQKKSEVSHKE